LLNERLQLNDTLRSVSREAVAPICGSALTPKLKNESGQLLPSKQRVERSNRSRDAKNPYFSFKIALKTTLKKAVFDNL